MSSSISKEVSASCLSFYPLGIIPGPKWELSRLWLYEWMTLRNCQAVSLFLIQKTCFLCYVTRLNLTHLCVSVSLQDFIQSLAHCRCSGGINGIERNWRDTCKGAASDLGRFKVIMRRSTYCSGQGWRGRPVIKLPKTWCHTQRPLSLQKGGAVHWTPRLNWLQCPSQARSWGLEASRLLDTDMIEGYSADHWRHQGWHSWKVGLKAPSIR